jgi:hypothetical protein
VLNPLDVRIFGGYARHNDDVESDSHPGQIFAPLKELACGSDESALLPQVDTSGSATVGITRAGAYFGDYEHLPLAGDNVKFSEATAVISVEDLEPFGAQEFGC